MISPKPVMKSLFSIFCLFLLAVGLSTSPVPYSGKVSIDGVNFSGTADFRFELLGPVEIRKSEPFGL